MSADMPLSDTASSGPIFFDRHELGLLLRVYGRMVAQGE